MPKKTESEVGNWRIDLVVDEDDPTKVDAYVNADTRDEDGHLVRSYRRQVDLDPAVTGPLVEAAKAAVLEDVGFTEADVLKGKERAQARKEARERDREREREEREQALEEAAEELRRKYSPNLEAEIEAAKERLRTQNPPLPMPEAGSDVPAEILQDALDKMLAERDRLLEEQVGAGEDYEQEQAERVENLGRGEAEQIRREREAEGLPVRPESPPRRPRR